jgi:hypothetical protein
MSEESTIENARVILNVISLMDMGALDTNDHHQFAQIYSLAKGIKELGTKGEQAAMKEMQQLHEHEVFTPIDINELTSLEHKRALQSLIFLTEKKDGQVKGRTCANGSTQRSYVNREDPTSPTAITEFIILTSVMEAKEGRDVMLADVPNAFVQTSIEDKNIGERVIMKIKGPLVDMLLNLDEEKYQPFVLHKGNNQVLFVEMQKALDGMLQSALLYYKKFKKDIEQIGFKINPYDPCVANQMINGHQHTITWHVDDISQATSMKELMMSFSYTGYMQCMHQMELVK